MLDPSLWFFLYAMVKIKPDTLLFSNLRVKREWKSSRSLGTPKRRESFSVAKSFISINRSVANKGIDKTFIKAPNNKEMVSL